MSESFIHYVDCLLAKKDITIEEVDCIQKKILKMFWSMRIKNEFLREYRFDIMRNRLDIITRIRLFKFL